jgi:tetratricopeptide (TPR) repeat protein
MEDSDRIARFKKVVAMDPNSEITLFGLGQAYLDEGRLEEAAQTFYKLIEVKPDYTAAYYSLSTVLDRLGRKEELIKVLEGGVKTGDQTGDHIPTQKMRAKLRRLQKGITAGSGGGAESSGESDRETKAEG